MLDSLSSNLTVIVAVSATSTVFLGTALAYLLLKGKASNTESNEQGDGKLSKRINSLLSLSSRFSESDLEDSGSSEVKAHINILFGSQTGTAESFANQISSSAEGEKQGIACNIVDITDMTEENMFSDYIKSISGSFVAENLSEPYYIIFLVSTYGEGEPADSTAEFYRMINEKSSGNQTSFFEHMSFTVFGLGNTQYEHYNAMGKFFDEKFADLGGIRFYKLGLGDDADDIEVDFEKWSDSLWKALDSKLNLIEDTDGEEKKEEQPPVEEKLPPCPYRIEFVHSDDTAADKVKIEEAHGVSKHYFTAKECPVTSWNEMINHAHQNEKPDDPLASSTLHVEFDLSSSNFSYQSADNMGIFAENTSDVVEAVAAACQFDLDQKFRVTNPKTKLIIPLFPTPCSIRECLSNYCDLTSPPRRSDLKLLSFFANDTLDKKVLLRLSSKESSEEYKQKIIMPHIGLYDIITKLCPSISIPLHRFLHVVPRLQPRYYTISSSPQVHKNNASITMAVLKYARNDNTIFKGLCSNYIKNSLTQNMRIFIRESTFRLPISTKPILMIGPGTGVAPMRALLQERHYQKTTLNLTLGKNILYFGCKHANYDELYREEFASYLKQGILTKHYNAFSRDDPQRKVYVQHLLYENKHETWELMQEDCSIYVCGGIKMGQDVLETLRKVVMEMNCVSADDAKKYLDFMHKEGRFVQELWA